MGGHDNMVRCYGSLVGYDFIILNASDISFFINLQMGSYMVEKLEGMEGGLAVDF